MKNTAPPRALRGQGVLRGAAPTDSAQCNKNNGGRISTATTIINKNLILYEIKTPATNTYLLQRIKMQFPTAYFYT